MSPIEFEGVNSHIAEKQDEYKTLPARKFADGSVYTKWQLTPEELEEVNRTGCVLHVQLTFNNPMQPIFLSVFNKDVFNQAIIDNIIEQKHDAIAKSNDAKAAKIDELYRLVGQIISPEDFALKKLSWISHFQRIIDQCKEDIRFIKSQISNHE